ncbi:hypothetical protein EJF36_19605 [Bacillus sp. HMF5848]|uniref:glycoside hydrolase family 66 protein n=1 Tax=Bacillus sp. HMF5848 TaxID=2495421 RepID=UPI000F777B3D|nr:glycoside hydrolase family 66 protein [Bacillus sp. HMF5848]RSK28905.1 hypothetical protein EJF36_19605 [Bacillus sp. HMF5848]
MRTKKYVSFLLMCLLVFQPVAPLFNNITAAAELNTNTPTQPILDFTVSKARYNPGEQVEMTLAFNQDVEWTDKLKVEVYHLNQKIAEGVKPISMFTEGSNQLQLTWVPPVTDFRGYLVKAFIEGQPAQYKTIAIDVSSDWTRFPRYGYTTEFPQETQAESDKKFQELSQQYYLNGYQFYDWMWRHDVSVYSEVDENGKPILDENGNFIAAPIDENTAYDDLLGRELFPLTVKQQIEAAQKFGSAAMAYEMNYAARENYEDYGVKKEWGLFRHNATFPDPDPQKYQEGFFFDWVDPPTALYLQDPGNPEWQQYISEEFVRAVNDFGFDGIHLDQWGWHDNDYLYDYFGEKRYFSLDYDSLINAVKDSLLANSTEKNFVTFNMVGGNGGYSAVPDPNTKTDFDYSEIWQDKDNYRDLKQVINDTRSKNGNKAMVIAAYMNYKQAAGDHYEAADVENVPVAPIVMQSRLGQIPGWVGDFGKKDEDKIIWTVNVPQAGTYDLTLRYGHGNDGGHPEGRLTVNNEEVASQISFSEKTGWGNPIATATTQVELQAGKNTVMLQLNSNNLWLNVDSLEVANETSVYEYEAEYADLISCKVDKFGHVYYFETKGDYVQFDVYAPEAGSYPISFNYGIEQTDITRHLFVNDQSITELSFPTTGGWESFVEGGQEIVTLNEGHNTITLRATANDTGMKLDYLRVGDKRYEAEKATLDWDSPVASQIQIEPGQTEAGFVENLNTGADSVTFDVYAEETGTQAAHLFYATSNNPTAAVSVNDTISQHVNITSSGHWAFEDGWQTELVPLPLVEGNNDVRVQLTSDNAYLDLDGLYVGEKTITQDVYGATAGGNVKINGEKTDDFNGAAGNYVEFTVNSTDGGMYDAFFSYRTGTSDTSGTITVNSEEQGTVIFKNNGWADGNWWGLARTNVILQPGENKIRLSVASESTYLNLHGLELWQGTMYEAEEAQTVGVNVTANSHIGDFNNPKGDSVTFNVQSAEGGLQDVTITYQTTNDEAYQVIINNELYAEPITLSASSNEWAQQVITLPVQVGDNTITLMPYTTGTLLLDNVSLDDTVFEAETGVLTGKASLGSANSVRGYAYNFGQEGDYLTFTIKGIEQAGELPLTITYKNSEASTTRAIKINGKKAGALDFPVVEDWSTVTLPVYVAEGTNEITILTEDASDIRMAVDKIELAGFTKQAEEADTGWKAVAPKQGSVNVELGKTDNHGHTGQFVTFDVHAKEDADSIIFKYRTGNNPSFDIYVDDVLIADNAIFGATPNGWDGSIAEKEVKANLSAGAHTIKLEMVTEGQYINIDSILVANEEYEVEDAAAISSDISVSTGHVFDFKDEGDFITFHVFAEQAGDYDVEWNYNNDSQSMRPATRAVYVNDVKVADLTFEYSNDWLSHVQPGVSLQEGWNTITIRVENIDDDGVKFDFLRVGDKAYHAEKADFTAPMVIFKDLITNFGHLGDEVTFTIDIEEPGETSLIFTYANEGPAASRSLYIDGEQVMNPDGKPLKMWFNGTGDLDKYNEDAYYIASYLSGGEHDVTLKYENDDKGSINLRRLTVGFFDEPSVRLMDAGLAALGATHIELGTAEDLAEGPNMLAHEYYPNRSKKMKESTKAAMQQYYKFFAAYENVLFDSVEDESVQVTVTDNNQTLATSKDGTKNKLWTVARKNTDNPGFEQYDVLHLINLLNNDENWRNAANEPELLTNLTVSYPVGITQADAPNLKVYVASPDEREGTMQEVDFEWNNTSLEISVPSLQYWSMILIDKDPVTPTVESLFVGDVPNLTVDVITPDSEVVTGTAPAGYTVTVMADGTVLGTGVVGEDNRFTVEIPSQPVDTKLTISLADEMGEAIEDQEVNVTDKAPIDECFIATAAYGTKFTPAVTLLRHFRDDFLLTSAVGTRFVEFYYEHSPKIAAFIADSGTLKTLVRAMLMPAVGVVYMVYHPMLLILVSMGAVSMIWMYRKKRAQRVIQ